MRLATAVGQTHGCYFLNKLSFLCNFGLSTWSFSSFNSLVCVLRMTKIEIISEKKVMDIYFLHNFALYLHKYSK
jgi:hypothetical protein